jgi:nucleoside-diphosphate-sugar epimerase
MNLLITGIHGFVGSNLVENLKDKHTIFGLDIVMPEKEGVEKTFLWNELTQIPDIDVVIHLAGKAHDTKNKADTKIYFDINTELTKKIFDKFLSSTAKQFVFFSSVKAAADIVEGEILTEDVTPRPKGPYGESKIAAENYILSKKQEIADQVRNDKRVYILRPCMIHGPGNKGNLNLLYGVVKKGFPYPLGAFENKRSFTSIDNLTFVIEQMLGKNISSGVYNISDDETLSTNELIRLMARVMNKPARIWNLSPKLIFLLAKIGTKIHLPLNTERLQKLTENYVVSNEKIKKTLNIKQMPISATEGFTKTIKSFDANQFH